MSGRGKGTGGLGAGAKRARDVIDLSDDDEGGMLFLFSLEDCVTEAYISHDPMFKEISGVHWGDVSYITDEMCLKMVEHLKDEDIHYTLDEIKGDFPQFLYEYASRMVKVEEEGLTPNATALVTHRF